MALQLDDTSAQLHELKLKQRQLEQRNFLLEKVAALNKQQATPAVSQIAIEVITTILQDTTLFSQMDKTAISIIGLSHAVSNRVEGLFGCGRLKPETLC